MLIEYDKGNRHYRFTFDYPLNLIIGDSATGKTDFVNQVRKNRSLVKTDATKIYINPIGMDFSTAVKDSIVLIDADDVLLEDIKDISNIKRNDITFVIFGRKFAKSFPFAVLNTFVIRAENGVKVNKTMYDSLQFKVAPFEDVIVEDSKSGLQFFKSVFRNVDTSNGNGTINKLVKGNRLLIIDSVGFGGYIEEFMKKVDATDNPYILYNSFESFILQEKFGVYDIPVCVNIEEGIFAQIKKYIPSYSKKMGCTNKACAHCVLDCKTSSKELFEQSKYSALLGYTYKNSFVSAIHKMKE